MKQIIIAIGIILIWTSYLFGQQCNYEKSFDELKQLRLKVIKDSIIGKKYYYDFTKVADCNKSCIRYLGQIKTNKGIVYKILTCFYVHEPSCRGTSRIVIYDIKNNYTGNYNVSMPSDLPDTIINNNLVYSNVNSDCKFRIESKISFGNGLSKNIFIPCDNPDNGDLYPFSNDE